MEKLTHDVMRVLLKLPEGQQISFKAGQYVNIILDDGQRRAFSFANPPHEPDFVELQIRLMPGGKFTTHVFEAMKEGDEVRFEGPIGDFSLRESERPIVFVAGATGFAPVKSMVEDAFKRGLKRQIHLYWGVKTLKDLYLPELPTRWAQEHDNFHFIPVLSEPESEDRLERPHRPGPRSHPRRLPRAQGTRDLRLRLGAHGRSHLPLPQAARSGRRRLLLGCLQCLGQVDGVSAQAGVVEPAWAAQGMPNGSRLSRGVSDHASRPARPSIKRAWGEGAASQSDHQPLHRACVAGGSPPRQEKPMITVIVEFKLPQTLSREQAQATFQSTAPKYQGMPGLIRKYYFLSEDGNRAGGIYLWNSRADADRVYTEEWKAFVRGKYASEPSLTYLECPLVVDNLTHEIIAD
jgi:ferredoxin-NADP reductase